MVVSIHDPPMFERGPMSPRAPVTHTNLRLPQALYEDVRKLAEEQGISVNAMMILLIRGGLASYPRQERPQPPAQEDK
jgi:hypothetical protein